MRKSQKLQEAFLKSYKYLNFVIYIRGMQLIILSYRKDVWKNPAFGSKLVKSQSEGTYMYMTDVHSQTRYNKVDGLGIMV